MTRRINEGGPPSTSDWNEFERRQPASGAPPRWVFDRPQKTNPLPALNDDQVLRTAGRLYLALSLCVEALDNEAWDGRWGNRLMAAHTYARTVIGQASQLVDGHGAQGSEVSKEGQA